MLVMLYAMVIMVGPWVAFHKLYGDEILFIHRLELMLVLFAFAML